MESGKKESNGLTIFLVILSSLGMLAVIVILAFVFFYPGDVSDLLNSKGPQVSAVDQRNLRIDMEPEVSAANPAEEKPHDDTLEMNQEEEISAELPDVDLDNSEAIINSLMEDDNTPSAGSNSDSPLDIRFDRNEEAAAVPEKQESVAPVRRDPAPEPAPQPRYRDVSRDVYWIQVASFPNSIKAEELQATLNQKGISSTIQTREINGTLYYRVRIGAFNSKGEAEQFDKTLMSLPQIDETRIYTSTVTERQRVE